MAKKRGPGRPPGPRMFTAREIAPVYGQIEGVLSRLEALVQTLGNNRVAAILGVSASQPSRWRSRKDVPTPEHQQKILDLDYVMANLFGEMMPTDGLIWLESFNHSLRTRPIDALAYGDFKDVLGAIEIEQQGGFV